MRIAQLRSLPWRLWWTQLRAILRIEWKKNFLSRRSWWIYLAALAPVILTAGHSLVAFYRGGANHTLAQDSRVFAGVFQLGYLRMFLFFGCAILFTNLFRGEVLNRTLHYYFLVPLRREVLAAGKYFSGLIAATVLYAGSVVLAYVMMFLHFGPQFEEFFYEGPGMAHLVSYAGVTVLACIGYGAVFTVMGLVFRNPMMPAAVVMVWEAANAFLPPLLKKVSVIFYLKSLCPVDVPVRGPVASLLVQEADPVPAWLAIPGLLLVSGLAMAYAAYRARGIEISYAE